MSICKASHKQAANAYHEVPKKHWCDGAFKKALKLGVLFYQKDSLIGDLHFWANLIPIPGQARSNCHVSYEGSKKLISPYLVGDGS